MKATDRIAGTSTAAEQSAEASLRLKQKLEGVILLRSCLYVCSLEGASYCSSAHALGITRIRRDTYIRATL